MLHHAYPAIVRFLHIAGFAFIDIGASDLLELFFSRIQGRAGERAVERRLVGRVVAIACQLKIQRGRYVSAAHVVDVMRSEEHTSEFQSLMRTSSAVFCLKKNKHNTVRTQI